MSPKTEAIEIIAVRNGHVALLRCEGVCSGVYSDGRTAWIARMRSAGYTPEEVRTMLTGDMLDRPHRHTSRVVDRMHREVRLGFTCAHCGHERLYGCEEL